VTCFRPPGHEERQQQCVNEGDERQRAGAHPEDLADQELAQVLAAVGVLREQEQRAACREHEGDADHRFLYLGPALVGPREADRTG
jgi:hypothetical protein